MPGKDPGELAAIGAEDEQRAAAVAKGGTLEIDADPTGALRSSAAKADGARRRSSRSRCKNNVAVPHNIALKGGGEGPGRPQGGTSSSRPTSKPASTPSSAPCPATRTAA